MARTRAYIGLGANLGSPARQIACALHRIANAPGVHGLRASRLYRTAAWGVLDQPDFVNAIARIDYDGDAHALLALLLAIELEAGRNRNTQRWGPRTLDLDLLIFGEARIDSEALVVPHPRMAERAFVLAPLAELADDLVIPGQGRVDELLNAVDARHVTALD